MRLPTALFLDSIAPGKIYYFQSNKLGTSVPHYFVCLCRGDNQMVILACCTSQFQKREQFIKSRNLPHSTLVWLPPNSENGFEKDTYVDCNSYFSYSIEELSTLYESNNLEFKGELAESNFHQVIKGLKDSPMIEESLKEILPMFDD